MTSGGRPDAVLAAAVAVTAALSISAVHAFVRGACGEKDPTLSVVYRPLGNADLMSLNLRSQLCLQVRVTADGLAHEIRQVKLFHLFHNPGVSSLSAVHKLRDLLHAPADALHD